MNIIKITEEPLSVGDIYTQVVAASTGAVSLFVGTTRDHFDNKKVIKLEYEAYVPMAEKETEKICQAIRAKWNVEHIAVFHRLGHVAVKEASVVIAISSEHRAESLQAVQFAIDELKSKVPIWKKEMYDEGDGDWKVNKECQWNKDSSRQPAGELKPVTYSLDPELVQIKASSVELSRRIDAFIERKRQQSDLVNVQEFCHKLIARDFHDSAPDAEETGRSSCARTEAVFVSRKDSKSHLRVSRVVNGWGPQTRPEPEVLHHIKTTDSQQGSSANSNTTGVDERLKNLEDHLNVPKPVAVDVYSRLKVLEDKVLFLESISPEYFQSQAITTENIERRMNDLRRKLSSMA